MGEVEELVARLLTSTTPNAIVPPEEPKKPFCGIAFVGIAPGEQEVIQGRPLVGPSGRIFDACLKAVGIDRESCWIGNLCPVRLNRDRGLSFHEVSILREPLLVAMEELQPQVIVTLGAEPTRAFFVEKDVEITLMRSHVLKSPALLADAKIVPTIHPAYILRQNLGLGALLLNDFMIAKKLLTGEPRYRPWDYHVISSLDELRELLFTHRGELMSLDTEATSENPFQAWPFIISFAFESSPDLGYVIHCPTRRYHPRMGPETLLDGSKSPTPIEDVLEEFKRANPRVVIQNMMYDYILLTRLGYSPEVYVDTMYAFSLLDENCPRNLSTLGSFFCGIGPYSTDYRSTDLHTWIPYAACDAVNTIRLWQALEPRFLDPRLRHLLFDYIMPLIYELSRMSLRGIWINRERLKDVGDVIQKEIDEKIRTMQVIAGMEFNPRSNDQLAVVFDKLNIPILGRTSKTRKPSFKKELLQKLEDRYPFVKLLLETKHLSKIHSSYIKNLHKYVDEHDVVHPIFDIKKTGRLSAVEPAVQTLPRDSVILELFTARPGHIFIKADFSAAELRWLGFLAGEERWLDPSIDLHVRNASFFYQVPAEQVTRKQRQDVKCLGFGKVYGSSVETLAKQLGCSLHAAQQMEERFFQTFPKIRTYMDKIAEIATERRVLQNYFGLERRFVYDMLFGDELDKQRVIREAYNFNPQSTVAMWTNKSLIILQQWFRAHLPTCHVVLQVHDSIVVEAPIEDVYVAMRATWRILRRPIEGTFFLPVDISVGPNLLHQIKVISFYERDFDAAYDQFRMKMEQIDEETTNH